MKISAVSGDTVVYLVVGLVAAVGLYYAYSRANRSISDAIDSIIALPGQIAGKAVEVISEVPAYIVGTSPSSPLYDINQTLGSEVIENPRWGGMSG